MEIVIKTAWDPDIGQEYEIGLPAPHVVEEAILKLDFPPNGLRLAGVADKLAEHFQLSDKQKNAMAKVKGKTFIFRDRIVYPLLQKLLKEGELEQPQGSKKGYILAANTILPLPTGHDSNLDLDAVPAESIDENYQRIQEKLAADLLDKIKNHSPAFFENLVIDLLVKMGYGGSREDAGRAVGRSGDGGIDGIINEDRLGLDVIYVQAKRWEGNVGEPPVRDFVGALDGEGVQKGIFITTSNFNPAAKNFAEKSSKRIILIDGDQLAQLMIEHNVGVSIEKTYEIKRVDSDYFAENTESS